MNSELSIKPKIMIFVICDSKIFRFKFSTIADLYESFRAHIIKFSKKYSKYYNAYDLPKFYFTYNAKPLYDCDLNYIQLNIHPRDYIFVHFVGLTGGGASHRYSCKFILFGEEFFFTYPIYDNIYTVAKAFVKKLYDRKPILDSLCYLRVYEDWSIYHDPPRVDLPIEAWNQSRGHRDLVFEISYDFRSYDGKYCEMVLFHNFSFRNLKTNVPMQIQSGFTDVVSTLAFRHRDYLEKLLEDLLIFLNGLRKYYDSGFQHSIVVEYIIIFLKLRNNKSLVSTIRSNLENLDLGILSYVNEILAEYRVEREQDQLHDLSLQSDNIFADVRNNLAKLKGIKKGSTYKTMYRLGMFAMSLSLFDSVGLSFDSLGYSKFEQDLIKTKYKPSSDLLLDLADGLTHLLERGYQFILTRNIDVIFHNSTDYAELYETINDLKLKERALHNPQAFGFSESWYVKTLDETIAKLQSVVKYTYSMDSHELKVMRCHLNDLQIIKTDRILSDAIQKLRPVPFAILFYAPPGVGKSSLVKITFRHFGATRNLPTDDCYMYTRNPTANFADGFSTRHWCWLADDVAFLRSTVCPTGDPTSQEMIQLLNNIQHTPDQASIENKGKIPALIDLFMATTNTLDLNAYHYFSCPAAVQRRLPFVVTVVVKPQYQKNDGSGMLDPAKCTTEEGSYPDYWILEIKKVVLPKRLHELATYETIFITDDINEYTAWVSRSCISHFEQQENMLKTLDNIKSIEICKTCYRNIAKCICTTQSGMSSLSGYVVERFALFIAYVLFHLLRLIAFIAWEKAYLYTRGQIDYLLMRFNCSRIRGYINRQMFINVGAQVQRKIGYPKFFASLLAAITAGYAMIKLTAMLYNDKEDNELQTAEESSPTKLDKERYNPWIINDYKLMNMDLSPPILSSRQFTANEFISMISHNIFSARIFDLSEPTKKWLNNVVCIKGNLYITNAHYFKNLNTTDDVFRMTLIGGETGEGVRSDITFTLRKTHIKFMFEQDLAIFCLPHAIPRKDILSYFPSKEVTTRCSGTLLTRMPTGEIREIVVKTVSIFHSTDSYDESTFDHKVTFGTGSEATKRGDCGSLMVLHSPKGHFLASIHRAGNDDRRIVGTCVFREQLDMLIPSLNSIYEAPLAPPNLTKEHFNIQTLHTKSVFNYIKSGCAEVYGSLGGFKRSYKSRVCRTIMFDFLRKHGYREKYTRPVLTGWEPWAIGAEDMVNPITHFDINIVVAARKSYVNKILNLVPKDKLKTIVHKYDQFTAINGAAGIAYVDKINRNTSTGYPFYTSKKRFLYAIPPENDLFEPVAITEEIQERIDFIEERYRQGLCFNPVFVASLKDEPVTFDKASKCKTRIFGSAPMDWTIVVRKYLLSTIRLIQNYKLTFEMAVGTVAQSSEWGVLHQYLTTFGEDTMIAGDFRKFDKKMSPVFIREAFEILISLCEESGNYDQEDLRAIRCIAADTAYPLMDFNNDLVKFFGSNPSGHSLTVIINSLVNSLYMRYVFVSLCSKQNNLTIEEALELFDAKVRLLTYGDDNVLNVSKDIPWFNHTTIAESFGEIGIEYTMADKNAESVPFISIQDVSFLKRTWRYDNDICAYAAPLDHDSIEKMLLTWVASDTIDDKAQCLAVLSSAIREYFFYGREIFNEKRELFEKLLLWLEFDLEDLDPSVLPSYDLLCAQFIENSQRIESSSRERISACGNLELQSGVIYDGPSNYEVVYFLIFYFICSFWFLNSMIIFIFSGEIHRRGFYAMFVFLTYLVLSHYGSIILIFLPLWLFKIRG